jgi:hypothetical protein
MNPMLTAARASADTNVIVLERRVAWNDSEALAQRLAAERRWPVMVYFGGPPGCAETEAFESTVVADPRVAAFIGGHVVPLRLRRSSAPAMRRYGVTRTPVVLVTDSTGMVYARIDSLAWADEFRARLALAVSDFECAQPEPPRPAAAEPVVTAPSSESEEELVAQSLHWQAASRFRRTGDTQRLFADWRAIAKRFPYSVWALRRRLLDKTRKAS